MVNNNWSTGLDAKIALDFHHGRVRATPLRSTAAPQTMCSTSSLPRSTSSAPTQHSLLAAQSSLVAATTWGDTLTPKQWAHGRQSRLWCVRCSAQPTLPYCGHASSAMKHHNHVKALPTIESQTKTSTMCTTQCGCAAAPSNLVHNVSVWAVVEAMEAAVVTCEDELEALLDGGYNEVVQYVPLGQLT